MKKFLAILICSLAIQTTIGQTVDTYVYKPQPKYKIAPLSSILGNSFDHDFVRYEREFAVSIFGNGLVVEHMGPGSILYDREVQPMYHSPYAEYDQSLYVNGNEMTRCFVGLQYYRSIWNHCQVGVLANVNSGYMDVYKRTSGERAKHYDYTDLLIAPVFRWNFLDGRFIKLYIAAGVAASAAFDSYEGISKESYAIDEMAFIGWSLGQKVYLFEEVGVLGGSWMVNSGLGLRF